MPICSRSSGDDARKRALTCISNVTTSLMTRGHDIVRACLLDPASLAANS